MGDRTTAHEWPAPARLLELSAEELGNIRSVASRLGVAASTLRSHLQTTGLYGAFIAHRPHAQAGGMEPDDLASAVHGQIKSGQRHSIEDIADTLDVSPRRVREGLELLRKRGFRIPDGAAHIERVVYHEPSPNQVNLHQCSTKLLDGDTLRIGVVSDTHLSSRECALQELHTAYDVFEREGITEVWHSGDWTAGLGVYRTQAQDLLQHTFESQVSFLEDEYPRRPGIRTRGISGNHDVEGEFGKIGANPVQALANRREDIDFLGDFAAWLELPNGAWCHLLHGRGGMSYAFSYKAQKLADSYPSGRKPSLLIPGHWHVAGWIEQRSVNVVFPGCFEWQTNLLTRIGLMPAVGFWILDMTLADDGSLVRFRPELFRFWEGRSVE